MLTREIVNYRAATWPHTSLVHNVIFCENKHIYREQNDASRCAPDTDDMIQRGDTEMQYCFSHSTTCAKCTGVPCYLQQKTECRIRHVVKLRCLPRRRLAYSCHNVSRREHAAVQDKTRKIVKVLISEAMQCRISTRMQTKLVFVSFRLFSITYI